MTLYQELIIEEVRILVPQLRHINKEKLFKFLGDISMDIHSGKEKDNKNFIETVKRRIELVFPSKYLEFLREKKNY